jgi:hypothetical protein
VARWPARPSCAAGSPVTRVGAQPPPPCGSHSLGRPLYCSSPPTVPPPTSRPRSRDREPNHSPKPSPPSPPFCPHLAPCPSLATTEQPTLARGSSIVRGPAHPTPHRPSSRSTRGSRQRTSRSTPLKRPAPEPLRHPRPARRRRSRFTGGPPSPCVRPSRVGLRRGDFYLRPFPLLHRCSLSPTQLLPPPPWHADRAWPARLRAASTVARGQHGWHDPTRAARSPVPPPVRLCPCRGSSRRDWRSVVASAALVPAQSCARSARSAQHPAQSPRLRATRFHAIAACRWCFDDVRLPIDDVCLPHYVSIVPPSHSSFVRASFPRVGCDVHSRDRVRYLARSAHIALVHCTSRHASVNHST